MKQTIIGVSLAAVLVLAGCGSKKEGDAAGKPASGESGGKPAEAKGGAVKLPKLGLAVDAPGETTVGDAIIGEGQMVQGSGVGAMTVEVAKAPQTLDAEKEDAKMYNPKNVKADTLPDGWALSFENKGGAGTNYWVTVYRTIDGKLYKCSTTGGDAGQAAAVLAACKSLRKG